MLFITFTLVVYDFVDKLHGLIPIDQIITFKMSIYVSCGY